MSQADDISPDAYAEESPEQELQRLRRRNRSIYRKRMAIVACAVLIAAGFHWRRSLSLWGLGEWYSIQGGGVRISASDAISRVYGENALVVDVRDPTEFEVSHLAGAVSLPLDRLMNSGWPEGWPTDRPIIVYCTIGYRSGQAAERLNRSGVAAENLVGGILALANLGEPLVNEAGPTLRVHTWRERYAWLLPNYCEPEWTENVER